MFATRKNRHKKVADSRKSPIFATRKNVKGMKNVQKKAIIIGATSGIGLEMVKVLTAQGWQVGIAGRRQERLQQIQSKNLDVVATECIDIIKEAAPRRLLSLIGRTGGMEEFS